MDLKTDSILTKAETRIALGYVDGKIGKEIAADNNLSYNTVVRHTQNIYDKTGIRRSTNALASWFIKVNYSLDLDELKRSIYGFVLFLIMIPQTVNPDFDNYPLRKFSSRRIETRASRRAMRALAPKTRRYYYKEPDSI